MGPRNHSHGILRLQIWEGEREWGAAWADPLTLVSQGLDQFFGSHPRRVLDNAVSHRGKISGEHTLAQLSGHL